MIRIETLEELPDLDWTEFSEKELALAHVETRDELIQKSVPVRLIRNENDVPLVVAGLYRDSLLSLPFFWILLTKDFAKMHVSEFRTLIRALWRTTPDAWTVVNSQNGDALRLAQAFGFKDLGDTVLVGSEFYRVLRRG